MVNLIKKNIITEDIVDIVATQKDEFLKEKNRYIEDEKGNKLFISFHYENDQPNLILMKFWNEEKHYIDYINSIYQSNYMNLIICNRQEFLIYLKKINNKTIIPEYHDFGI